MIRTIAIMSAAALALSLAACGKSGGGNTAGGDMAAENTTMAEGNATSADMNESGMNDTAVTDSSAAPMTGNEFANAAASTDAFEIAEARIADSKSDSAAVKAFARQMIKAHTESTAKVKQAAAEANPKITPNPALSADQQAKVDALRSLSGAALDRQYAADQVDAHQKALGVMRDYSSKGSVPSLKAVAGEIEPIVEDHLTMAQKLPQG